MSHYRILDGKVEPIRGHFESDGYTFTLEDPQIGITPWRMSFLEIPINKLGNIAMQVTDLPYKTQPDNYSFEEMGDNLQLGYQWYTDSTSPNSDTTPCIFLALNETINNTNIKEVSRMCWSNFYNHGFNLTISDVTTQSAGEYYNETSTNISLGNAILLFQFVYDTQSEKVYQIPYWYGVAESALTDLKSDIWQLGIGHDYDYLFPKFESSITINNGSVLITNAAVKIDVTAYVNYVEYSEYDDGNGSNPSQGQNDDNVGGDGNHDNSSDTTDSSDYYDKDNDSPFEPQSHDPNWNSGTPLYTLFKMTFTQVGNLINYLTSSTWTSAVTNLGLGSVFGAIAKCFTVPFDVSSFYYGYSMKILGIDTSVGTSGVVNHLQEINCGNITIDRYFGDFKDYAPYTKCYIYLPYIGVNEISINQVQGKALSLVYGVDLLDGSCVARLSADNKQLYSFSGNMATEYPIVGKTPSSPLSAVTNILGNISGNDTLVATAGLLGSVLTSQNSSSSFQTVGGVAGNWGNVGVLTPFVYLERPVQSRPNAYESQYGYTCNKYLQLSTLSGYTEVDDSIHLAISATEEEKERIMEYLTSGFYINSHEH